MIFTKIAIIIEDTFTYFFLSCESIVSKNNFQRIQGNYTAKCFEIFIQHLKFKFIGCFSAF